MKIVNSPLFIRQYADSDRDAVIALWQECDLLRPWNDPERDIARKLQVNRELFLVGVLDDKIVASVMGGYEGHRGWMNYLAVAPVYRKQGLGRRIVREIEQKLGDLGCPKVNLQVRSGNRAALAFYEKIGYANDDVISLGKRLVKDD